MQQSSTLSKICFSIVGCGAIAQRHATHAKNYGELHSVYDIDIEKANQFAANYSCIAYTSYQELLLNSKAQVIVICTPNYLHATQSILALKNGFHVICEKPMALTSIDCLAMITTATNSNRQLFIVKQNRYNPPVAAVKKAIEDNVLGKILSLQLNCFWNRDNTYYQNSTWKGKQNLDGGILYTQFSHFIDLLIWMFGEVEEVKAMSKNYRHNESTEFADTVTASVHFISGILATIHCTINSFKKNMEGSITIFGEKGTIKIGGEYLNVLEYQNIQGYSIDNLPKGNAANMYGSYTGSMSNHPLVYKNVIDVLQNKALPDVNMYDGLKTVTLIEKIYKACIN